MKEIQYPEEGDEVLLADGKVGSVSSESPVSQDEGDWQIEVEEIHGEDEEELPEDEQSRSDVPVRWDSNKRAWTEIEG